MVLLDSKISHACIERKALELDIIQTKHLFDCFGFTCEISVANFVENDNPPLGHQWEETLKGNLAWLI